MSSVETPDGAPEFRRKKRVGLAPLRVRRRRRRDRRRHVRRRAAEDRGLPRRLGRRHARSRGSGSCVLAAATALNLATFAPPWMVTLPGLRFRQALAMTQASTALSIVAPGGAAIGMAGSWGMLRAWGFRSARRDAGDHADRRLEPAREPRLPGRGALPAQGERRRDGAARHGRVRRGRRARRRRRAARARPLLGRASRTRSATPWRGSSRGRRPGSVAARSRWGGASFARFRAEAVDLLARRWHVLTLATFAGSLTVFLLLVLSLRAVGVPASEVT